MSELARLLVPVIRWDPARGFQDALPDARASLSMGVGGFILFGGEEGAVRDLLRQLYDAADRPLLIGSDLERGAGQQVAGATPLPPAAAIGALGENEIARRAGELTAREARALGIGWVFAPVADLDLEPRNPIVGTRAFGEDPAIAGPLVGAWARGCREGGALACLKHFPGHGRTVADSHAELPVVEADREALRIDLHPFLEAFKVHPGSVMTAHVAYPALDPTGVPATLSRPILHDLLREELGFGGLVVTDALIMEGLIEGTSEADAAVQAVAAGCDALLYPDDVPGVLAALETAVASGTLSQKRVDDALRRVAEAAERGGPPTDDEVGSRDDRAWALEIARRSLRVARGEVALPTDRRARLVQVDDDVGGPYPPYPRAALPAALKANGVRLDESGPTLVALYADIRAWKGRPGLSDAAVEAVRREVEREPGAVVLLFAHPRLAGEIPFAGNVLVAWGGEGLMQEAVAAQLTGAEDAVAGSAGGLDR